MLWKTFIIVLALIFMKGLHSFFDAFESNEYTWEYFWLFIIDAFWGNFALIEIFDLKMGQVSFTSSIVIKKS